MTPQGPPGRRDPLAPYRPAAGGRRPRCCPAAAPAPATAAARTRPAAGDGRGDSPPPRRVARRRPVSWPPAWLLAAGLALPACAGRTEAPDTAPPQPSEAPAAADAGGAAETGEPYSVAATTTAAATAAETGATTTTTPAAATTPATGTGTAAASDEVPDTAEDSGTAGDPAADPDSDPAGGTDSDSDPGSTPALDEPPEVASSWAVAPVGEDRLLTEMTAEVGPGGVALAWAVDEDRAGRIDGFSCVFRSPGHLRLGAPGVVQCLDEPIGPQARSVVLSGLPEFGEYDLELSAQITGAPVIEWTLRALRMTFTVTETHAGPPGPGRTVVGVPLVAACGPGGEAGWAAGGAAWERAQIVSAAHLTHYPGSGWAPGGDAAAAPDWPEPPSLSELFEAAGVDAEPIQQVLEGDAASGGDTVEQAAALLAGEAAADPLARASAGTKALLRRSQGPDSAGGWELRLHSSYPFGSVYAYDAAHAVAGWGRATPAATQAELWNRTDCPPAADGHATHDVALALSTDAGGRALQHSGYGWWAVAPVGLFPERVVATKGGLSYGEPAAAAPAAGTVWEGRVSGHLFWQRQRWALGADATLNLISRDGQSWLSGRIDNTELVPLDPDTLEPTGPPLRWRSLTLADGVAVDGAWSGPVGVGPSVDAEPPAMPALDAFEGDWRVAAYGPGASEVAGRLRLWTPLAADDDPADAWPAQALVVAGFGGTAR